MNIKKFLVFFCLLLAGCTQATVQPGQDAILPTPTSPTELANLPNPASVYCEQQGYKSEIRTADDGSQSGPSRLFSPGRAVDLSTARGDTVYGLVLWPVPALRSAPGWPVVSTPSPV